MWQRDMRRICRFLTGCVPLATIPSDKQSAPSMNHNLVSRVRIKHIDICHHFVREHVLNGIM